MPSQSVNWTCSACALAWVLRATKLDPPAGEWQCVDQIGYPDNINATYGLMDGSGSQLRRVLSEYDQSSSQAWLGFSEVYALAGKTTGMMSGGCWYHWVAIRGQDGNNIWIANSAPGYRGVWDSLSLEEFQRLGPFSVVWLEV
jgi:hypothetical protein